MNGMVKYGDGRNEREGAPAPMMDKKSSFLGVEFNPPRITVRLKGVKVTLEPKGSKVKVTTSRPDGNVIRELGQADVAVGVRKVIHEDNEEQGAEDRALGNARLGSVGSGSITVNLGEDLPISEEIREEPNVRRGEV